MKKMRFTTLTAVICLFSVSYCNAQTGASLDIWPGESWAVSTPEAEGIDPAVIEALHTDFESGAYGLIDHFLLIRHGKIVVDYHYEQDYEAVAAQYDTTGHQYNYDDPDWHPYYQGTLLHTLQSVTKSVMSAALGIAIDEGFIPGVDVPAMSFFEGYEIDLSDPRKAAMTLDDMLTMRSGFDWNEMISYDDATNSAIMLEASDEWIQFVLNHGMREDPGTRFDYNSGVSVLLGKIVGVATGVRVDKWAEEKLFNPIGITDYYWKISPDNEADTEGGLYLSTHDLARIGYLFLRGGMWDGERVISEDWVRASTFPIVRDTRPDNNRQDSGYGYQWWVPDHDSGQTIVFAGNGYGGQFVLVAPEYDIVAVFNSWNIHGGQFRSTWRVLQQRILPAVR